MLLLTQPVYTHHDWLLSQILEPVDAAQQHLQCEHLYVLFT